MGMRLIAQIAGEKDILSKGGDIMAENKYKEGSRDSKGNSKYDKKMLAQNSYYRKYPGASWQDWMRSTERQAMIVELNGAQIK